MGVLRNEAQVQRDRVEPITFLPQQLLTWPFLCPYTAASLRLRDSTLIAPPAKVHSTMNDHHLPPINMFLSIATLLKLLHRYHRRADIVGRVRSTMRRPDMLACSLCTRQPSTAAGISLQHLSRKPGHKKTLGWSTSTTGRHTMHASWHLSSGSWRPSRSALKMKTFEDADNYSNLGYSYTTACVIACLNIPLLLAPPGPLFYSLQLERY